MSDSLSPVTAQWVSLFNLYATIGVAVGTVVIAWLVYNAVRYRERPGQEPEDAPRPGVVPRDRGTVGAALILTLIVAGILFSITLGTMATVDLIEKPPGGSLDVKVIGFQWGWKFVYPNGKTTVGELRVPRGEVINLYVTSQDVFHKFQLMDFKVGVDAIPGSVNRVWIKPSQTGTFIAQCFELCGVGHSFMTAKLVVMEPGDFESWYRGGESK